MTKAIIRLYIFASGSSAGKSYQTLEYSDGALSCDCKGWTIKRAGTANGERSCKHTRFVQAGCARDHAQRIIDYRTGTAPAPRIPQRELSEQRSTGRAKRSFDLEDAG